MTEGLQIDCNTQRFSAEAEGGFYLNILTEEELNSIETANDFVTLKPQAIKEIIDSHRAIQERNRNLVLENDELNARDIENKQDITKLTTLLRLIALKITDVEVLDMVTPVVLEIFERRAREMLSHD